MYIGIGFALALVSMFHARSISRFTEAKTDFLRRQSAYDFAGRAARHELAGTLAPLLQPQSTAGPLSIDADHRRG